MTVEWSCLELRKIKEVEISSIYGVRAFAAAPTSLTCYPVLSQAGIGCRGGGVGRRRMGYYLPVLER
jgi:hypothetical protein